MTKTPNQIVHLRAAAVSVVYDLSAPTPQVLHWGADLGPLDEAGLAALSLTAAAAVLNNAPDTPRVFSMLPTEYEAWSGTPAIAGHLGGTRTTPRPKTVDWDVEVPADGVGGALSVRLRDSVTPVEIDLHHRLTHAGLLETSLTLRRVAEGSRTDDTPYDLTGLLSLMPVPGRADEILELSGKWCRERSPQRTAFIDGTHARHVRRGKPGHDSPYLMFAGTSGFGFRHGEVWASHVAWSGNQHWLAERLPEGAGALRGVLGGGELLTPGEVRLMPGAGYQTPRVVYAWSDAGMDGVADRFHTALRSRPQHPTSPRPLVLNTWEVVYFDHALDRLLDLADRAAQVGVERVVLDDGWFGARRDATAGLGDWSVSTDAWPEGLHPFVDRIREHGMQFGLWFEPEMVNLDSDLARVHPEWLLAPSAGLGPSSRQQYVLNIAHPDAWAYLHEQLRKLIGTYGIDFIKWDHNRDLHEAVWRDPDGDRPAVHEQTVALYRLIDALKADHPGLEIESCAGGGGRIDLGILERTDRVWPSDCNDPIEREVIQQWTSLLLPPELIASHVGGAESHTTHRVTATPFRLITSLFAHAGIEWDLTRCNAGDLRTLREWAGLYREARDLLHTGRTVHADLEDPATLLHGVVAGDGTRALYVWARLATSAAGQSGRVRFPSLDPAASYRVRIRRDLGDASLHQNSGPAWFDAARTDWITLPGTVLATAGVPMPTLNPQQALLIELERLVPCP
ncbi:alpha-galactosidase [Actinoallomurus purpureus]|uniref:alpha-galactosidase n=1 Tax=Actinoallomurus purpureus TaxID=478114 RepID=UPI0020932B52|nr:alpha-galactosidase [Actinoallomurus purpureus]MCO6006986.1 alpha-galactosidase [Actinoallomurus purpureus]